MTRYKIERPYTSEIGVPVDTSRSHAVNWAVGIALLAFVVYIVGWSVVQYFTDALSWWSFLLCIPVAILLGIGMGAIKLLNFTTEHREWLYWIEEIMDRDLDNDGVVGAPEDLSGTFLMGIDGAKHRIHTELTVEQIREIRGKLLMNGKVTVRGLQPTIGEQASQFRDELIGLGICKRPVHPNAAAVLSDAGFDAVIRW